MGCGKSTLADGLDANQNTVIISKEDQANGNGEELVKIEGVEAAEKLLPDENQEPTMVTVTNRQSRLRKSDGGRGIENAWGAEKVTKNVEEVVLGKPQVQILNDTDFESEYGKDGVDMTSTSVGQDTDKLVNNCVDERTSPDGTNFGDYNEGMNKPRALCKQDESDEAFDPSALIDIEKFKAANALLKQPPTTNKDSGKESDDSTNVTNPGEAEIGTPSNYTEFYDDDEKQLIASIENDFIPLSPPALPGSVM